MKVLLDECVDWRLLRELPGYDVRTVKRSGWLSKDDTTLLQSAAAEFDVFVTVDKDLPYQQNVSNHDVAIIVLRGRTTRLPDLRELLPALRVALETTRRGEVRVLNWRDLK